MTAARFVPFHSIGLFFFLQLPHVATLPGLPRACVHDHAKRSTRGSEAQCQAFH